MGHDLRTIFFVFVYGHTRTVEYCRMATKAVSTPVTASDVLSARDRISTRVHCTPLLQCSYLNSITGYDLYFKCENFQKVPSYGA